MTGNSVSALANAVRAGDVSRVSAMLKLRPELVNIELAENDERTALHFAVLGRSAEIVRLLMQGGANARKGVYPHRAATTALTIATDRGARGRGAMAEPLLKRGANPNLHVYASGSPVYSAYRHRQPEMIALFKRYGGVVGAGIAGLYRETDLARQMLEDETHGPLPEGMVSPGRTAAEDLLDYGSCGGDAEIVRMALERIDWPRGDDRWFWMLGRSLETDANGSSHLECFRQLRPDEKRRKRCFQRELPIS